jgi:uncharacterized protein YqjF (DUF2071 family)
MHQTWAHLLFAHWRVPERVLRPLIPDVFEIETFDGDAWVAVVPFLMDEVYIVGLPPIPTTYRFPELNVRTYVNYRGTSGVWFFSLDATSILAVAGARAGARLAYFRAEMSIEPRDAGWEYRSRRRGRSPGPAHLDAWYRPTGQVFTAEPGSLEDFLTTRLTLFTFDRNRVYRVDVEHAPWPLQPAEAHIRVNTMASAAGIPLPGDPPHLLYSERLDILAGMPRRLA